MVTLGGDGDIDENILVILLICPCADGNEGVGEVVWCA